MSRPPWSMSNHCFAGASHGSTSTTCCCRTAAVGRQQWVDHAITSPDGRRRGTARHRAGHHRSLARRRSASAEARSRLREAYERIRSLAHRLILAQEAERTEIARDLHDDVSQQLAALGIGLSLVEARADRRR